MRLSLVGENRIRSVTSPGGQPMIRPECAQQCARLAASDGRTTSACHSGPTSPAQRSLSRLYFYRTV